MAEELKQTPVPVISVPPPPVSPSPPWASLHEKGPWDSRLWCALERLQYVETVLRTENLSTPWLQYYTSECESWTGHVKALMKLSTPDKAMTV